MTYTMHDALEVANLAATDISAWLCSKPETISVVNVEDHPEYQRRDVDLIWTTQTGEILPGRFITRRRLKPSSHILNEAYSLYQLAEIDLSACNFLEKG